MLPIMPYGDRWRRSRRHFQQNFRKTTSRQYEPLQLVKVRELLKALLTSLDTPGAHFKTCVCFSFLERSYLNHGSIGGAVAFGIIYDLDMKPPNDYYFNLAEEAMVGLSEMLRPTLVNVLPALRHLPRWVPGFGFRKAASVGKLITEMKDGTFEYARNQMVHVISFVDVRDSEFDPSAE